MYDIKQKYSIFSYLLKGNDGRTFPCPAPTLWFSIPTSWVNWLRKINMSLLQTFGGQRKVLPK